MKKIIAIFMVVALCATAVFAIDLSAGGDFDFTHQWESVKSKTTNSWDKHIESTNALGFNGFFDAQYVRVGLGANFTVGGVKIKDKNSDGLSSSPSNPAISYANLRLSILGKYPFAIGEVVKLYPLAGFEFDFNISKKEGGNDLKAVLPSDVKKDLNHYYFVAGMGADIFVTGNLFLTPKATFGIDMKKPSGYKETKENLEKFDINYTNNTFKFDVGIGVGYKF